MSRGRKAFSINYRSDWHKCYEKNSGTYLKLIINDLARINKDSTESNYKLLKQILSFQGKSITEVKEEDKLFKIPINWFWAKLPDVCEIATGNKDVNEGHLDGIYPFFTCAQEPLKSNTFSFDGDCILLPGNGANVGYVNRYNGKFELYQRTYCLNKINNSVSVDFLELYFRAFWKDNLGQQFGSGINYLRISNFTKFVIPIPPTSMQNSIVSFLNDLESNNLKSEGCYFDTVIENKIIFYHKYQINGVELQNELVNQIIIVKKLRQQFLQDAVQGKLVEQDSNDEAGSELLKKIKTEKAKLFTTKKLKKEKELPPIKPEEIPFGIPENWVWCRLGEIINYTDNFDIQKKLSPITTINYIDIDAIDSQNQVIREVKQKMVSELSTRARRVLKKGYIMYSTVRPYLKNIAIIDIELENFIGSTGFNVFNTVLVDLKYVFNFLLTPMLNNKYKEMMVGFNSPSITNEQFEQTLIPLPPLGEQNRIIQKLEELIQYCNDLEATIKQCESQNEKLLQQVLREALK